MESKATHLSLYRLSAEELSWNEPDFLPANAAQAHTQQGLLADLWGVLGEGGVGLAPWQPWQVLEE